MRRDRPLLALLGLSAAALLWAVPFAWMALASLRPNAAGRDDVASLYPSGPFGFGNFIEAWQSGHFPLWYLNTIMVCLGILVVQCVTISLAGYAFARLRFRGRDTLFLLFLLQLMLVPPVLIVPNVTTLVGLGLYDTLPGIMAPYLASAFGVFLMRQTFRQHPARLRGGGDARRRRERRQLIWHVLLPLARPGTGWRSPWSPSPLIGPSSCGR